MVRRTKVCAVSHLVSGWAEFRQKERHRADTKREIGRIRRERVYGRAGKGYGRGGKFPDWGKWEKTTRGSISGGQNFPVNGKG